MIRSVGSVTLDTDCIQCRYAIRRCVVGQHHCPKRELADQRKHSQRKTQRPGEGPETEGHHVG